MEIFNTLHSLLFDKRKVYKYKSLRALNGEHDLYLLVRSITRSRLGKLLEFYYDDLILTKTINPETESLRTNYVRITVGPIFVHFFEISPLEGFIGILARSSISNKLLNAIESVVRRESQISSTIFGRVLFDIFLKEKEIRKIQDFLDVVEIIVENVADPYIDWAWVKGSMLDQSSEYYKFVEGPTKGRLKVLAIRFQNRVYYLYNDGRIFTRQADISNIPNIIHEIQLFSEIVKRLHKINAVRIIN